MEMGKASAGSSDCASSTEDVSVGFKSCFQCCFHLEEPLWSQTKACLHGLPNLTFLPPPLLQWPQQPESVLPADICRLVQEFPELTRLPPLSPSVGLTFWLQLWAATSATEVLNMTQLGKGFQTLPTGATARRTPGFTLTLGLPSLSSSFPHHLIKLTTGDQLTAPLFSLLQCVQMMKSQHRRYNYKVGR